MKIEILKKPFDQAEVKTRKAGGGRVLKYADGATYVRRLNEAFDHDWKWTILSRERCPEVGRDGKPAPDELVVLGRLEAGGVVHEAFGGSTVGRGENLGDDWKSAATDALKKAASLFGIGLELYTDVQPPEETPTTTAPSSKPSATKGGAAASDAQRAKIRALLEATGMPEEVLVSKVRSKYACAPGALTVEQAAAVITYLEGIAARGKAA